MPTEQCPEQLNPFKFCKGAVLLPFRGEHHGDAQRLQALVVVVTAARSKRHHELGLLVQHLLEYKFVPVADSRHLARSRLCIQSAVHDIFPVADSHDPPGHAETQHITYLRRREDYRTAEWHVQHRGTLPCCATAHLPKIEPLPGQGRIVHQREALYQGVSPNNRTDFGYSLAARPAHPEHRAILHLVKNDLVGTFGYSPTRRFSARIATITTGAQCGNNGTKQGSTAQPHP